MAQLESFKPATAPDTNAPDGALDRYRFGNKDGESKIDNKEKEGKGGENKAAPSTPEEGKKIFRQGDPNQNIQKEGGGGTTEINPRPADPSGTPKGKDQNEKGAGKQDTSPNSTGKGPEKQYLDVPPIFGHGDSHLGEHHSKGHNTDPSRRHGKEIPDLHKPPIK